MDARGDCGGHFTGASVFSEHCPEQYRDGRSGRQEHAADFAFVFMSVLLFVLHPPVMWPCESLAFWLGAESPDTGRHWMARSTPGTAVTILFKKMFGED